MEHSAAIKGTVRDAILTYAQAENTVTVPVDSTSWYSWLEMATAFTFRDKTGSFTAQKKRASNRRGKWYWYAYRRRNGQLFSSYLGTSSRLTLERLRNIAQQLALRGESAKRGESANMPNGRGRAVAPTIPERAPSGYGRGDGSASPASPPTSPAGQKSHTGLTSDTSEATNHHEPGSVQCSFLATKLRIPRLPVHHIVRSRLLSALDQAVEARLTLVSAPAGSGKTTLLAAWARASSVPVAWLSLEAADDDPLRFLVYLKAALTHVDTNIEKQDTRLTLLAHGYSWDDVLTHFVNELTQILTRDTVLILDDYHLVASEPIHAVLRFLIEHAPEQLHLLIGTRVDPPLSLARQRSHNQLNELKGEELRFSPDELQAFLREMGLTLSTEAQSAIDQQTQGWIVGVQLLALALRGHTDPASFLQAHPGSHRFFLEYVSEEILAHQTDEMRDFLLRTSILERLTGSLCEAVTGLSDGQAMLNELYRTNLLLRALDDTGTWYSYHPLFAETLRTHLLKQRPELLPELYRRASHWHEQQNWSEQACEYAFLAGDLSHAAHLLAEQVPLLIAQGKWARLSRWLKRLSPDLIAASPQLWLASIWMQCSIEKVQNITDFIEQQVQERTNDDFSSNREVQQELALFHAWAALLQDDLPRTVSLILETLRTYPRPESTLSRLIEIRQRIVLSTAYRALGQLDAAEQALLDALYADETDADRLLNLMAQASLAELYEARGKLHILEHLYSEMLQTLSQLNNPSPPFLALTQARYAALLYERNRLPEAEQAAQRARQLTQLLDLPISRASLLSLWVQVRVALARGHDESIQHLLESQECDFAQWQTPHQMTLLEEDTIPVQAIPARLALATGRLEQAECWERGQQMHSGLRIDNVAESQLSSKRYNDYMTISRILLARGRSRRNATALAQARDLLDYLYQAATGCNGWLIEIRMLTALVLHAQGKIKQALIMLGQILPQAEIEGYGRLFADEGQPMAHMLAQVAGFTSASPAYIQALLAAIPSTQGAPAQKISSAPRQPLIEPLSMREQEVLHLLAAGSSNQQIADQLVISLHTVKLHIKHIFAKLTVTNRTQAVIRARELHVI